MAEVPLHNEHESLAEKATYLVDKSLYAKTEVKALTKKVLASTQVDIPSNTLLRKNFVNKLASIVQTYDAQAYDEHVSSLRDFLKTQISSKAFEQHTREYSDEGGQDRVDLAKAQMLKLMTEAAGEANTALLLVEKDYATIAPWQQDMVTALKPLQNLKNPSDPLNLPLFLNVGAKMQNMLSTFYKEESIRSRALVLWNLDFREHVMSDKSWGAEKLAKVNHALKQYEKAKREPLSFLQEMHIQYSEKAPAMFPDRLLTAEWLAKNAIAPQWLDSFKSVVKQQEDSLLFGKGAQNGAVVAAEDIGKIFMGGLTFVPELSYELGKEGNTPESVPNAFENITEYNSLASGIKDTLSLANNIAKTWSESLIAQSMDGAWKEQFLQDMSEDKLVESCAKYLNPEALLRLWGSLPPEEQGKFVGSLSVQLTSGLITQMGTAQFLKQFPALHSTVDMKSFQKKIGEYIDNALTGKPGQLPVENRSRKLMSQTGALSVARPVTPSKTPEATISTPLYKSLLYKMDRSQSSLADFMEGLTKTKLFAPEFSTKIVESKLYIKEITPKSLLSEHKDPYDFVSFMESVKDPDMLEDILFRSKPPLIDAFAKGIGEKESVVRSQMLEYIIFMKQKRVMLWAKNVQQSVVPTLRADVLQKIVQFKPDADKLTIGKLDELFVAQLLEEYCYAPIQHTVNTPRPSKRVLLTQGLEDQTGVDFYAAAPEGGKYYAIDLTSDDTAVGTKISSSQTHRNSGTHYKYENFLEHSRISKLRAPIVDAKGEAFTGVPGAPQIEKRIMLIEDAIWKNFRVELAQLIYKNSYTAESNPNALNRPLIEAAFDRSLQRARLPKISLADYLQKLMSGMTAI